MSENGIFLGNADLKNFSACYFEKINALNQLSRNIELCYKVLTSLALNVYIRMP